MTPFRRDDAALDARRTDAYLEGLLAARERGGADAPADAALDPEIRRAARRLAAEPGRVHPSFRFEERLAARLAAAAAGLRAGSLTDEPAHGPAGRLATERVADRLITLPVAAALDPRPLGPAVVADERTLRELLAGLPGAALALLPVRPVIGARGTLPVLPALPVLPGRASRPMLIGGALTSALSLAGAALVAWRWTHPQLGPMARAVRAAHPGRGRRAVGAGRPLPPGLGGGLA